MAICWEWIAPIYSKWMGLFSCVRWLYWRLGFRIWSFGLGWELILIKIINIFGNTINSLHSWRWLPFNNLCYGFNLVWESGQFVVELLFRRKKAHNINQIEDNKQYFIWEFLEMEGKLNYLLDRNAPFTEDKVKLLDTLTLAMNSNGPDVLHCWCSPARPLKSGGGSRRMITSGITPIASYKCHKFTKPKCSCWSSWRIPSK